MATKSANQLRSIGLIGQYINEFHDELRVAREHGKAVAWCDGVPMPYPILRAMDVSFLYGDAYAATLSARHLDRRLYQISDDAGYLTEVCGYTRSVMGCALMSDEERANADPMHQVPTPDLLIVTDFGCSMLVNWADAERQHFKVPMFVIQFPHMWHGEGEEAEAVADVTRQLADMVTFVEDVLHRKLDWDRLREIMVDVKESVTYYGQARDMVKTVPAPATIFDLFVAQGGMNYLLGTQECVNFYRNLRDELADRVTNKVGALVEEQYRLYWDGLPCWPKLGHLSKKFANLGACFVLGRCIQEAIYTKPELIDPDKPLESLAANLVGVFPNQNLDWIIENTTRLCEEHSIDGLVMHAHRTCRPIAGQQLELLDAVSRRLGIPGICIEGDMADETYYSDAQVDTRIQGLLETIDARKHRRY